MNLLLAGATGLVGSHVLQLAFADPRITQITAPTRKPLPAHPKLTAPTVDFNALPPDADWWHADAMICALGTTMKTAGSREAFRRVDLDYPLAVARLAHEQGTTTYVLNSAMGADPGSRIFYNRTKGELEQALAGIGFASLTFARPGFIGGERNEYRSGERAMVVALQAIAPVLPKRFRINPAENVAQAMLDAAVAARPGMHVIGSDALA
jgi:uncharacterized protein YbjT (DUF2867 family)